MTLSLTPIEKLDLTTHYIPPHPTRRIPNTPPRSHPLLVYRSAFDPTTPPAQIEMHLQTKRIVPQWRYTMYKTSHFHSTSHEVLCVYSGKALLLFGGDDHPDGVEVELKAGDTVVVPAGVAHRLLEDRSTWKDVGGEQIEEWEGGFLMVGGYPRGCDCK